MDTHREGEEKKSVRKKLKPLESLDQIARASIRGLYGGPDVEGMDERVWGDIDNHETRELCLNIAVLRMVGEGKQYQGRLFRRILEAVVQEQSDGLASKYADVPL